jgi:hypothetical protein
MAGVTLGPVDHSSDIERVLFAEKGEEGLLVTSVARTVGRPERLAIVLGIRGFKRDRRR